MFRCLALIIFVILFLILKKKKKRILVPFSSTLSVKYKAKILKKFFNSSITVSSKLLFLFLNILLI